MISSFIDLMSLGLFIVVNLIFMISEHYLFSFRFYRWFLRFDCLFTRPNKKTRFTRVFLFLSNLK